MTVDSYENRYSSLASYFKKSFSTGFLNVFGSAIVSSIFIPLLIQQLGIELYGKWSLIFILVGISNVADLGLSKALVYLIPKQNSIKNVNDIFSAALILNLILLFLFCVACCMIYFFDINFWQTEQALSPNLGKKLFITGSFIAFCTLASQFCTSILESFFKIHLVNLCFLLLTTLNYVPLYYLSLYTNDINVFLNYTALVYAFILIIQIVLLKLFCNVNFILPGKHIFRDIFLCSSKFFLIGLLIASVLPLNRYLLIYFSDNASSYGVFDIAIKIAMMANSMLVLFATPMLSLFSGLGAKKISYIKRILRSSFALIGISYITGCLVFYFAGRGLIKWLFDIESSELYTSSLILILGMCLVGVAEPYYRAFLALGKLRFPFYIKTILLILNALCLMIFCNTSPLYRVSIAVAASYAFTAFLTIIWFQVSFYHTNNQIEC